MSQSDNPLYSPEASPLLGRGRGEVAIYGGTFNPIHIGHTSLAESLVEQGLVDEVWLLVSPLNPFKQYDTAEFASYDDRLRMTELAASERKGLRASDFENHLPVPSYMYTTLCELSRAYPENKFTLVIGADNWLRFSDWYESEKIIANYRVLIYRRPGYELDEESIASLGADIHVIDTPLYDVSSTQIRQAIKRGERPSEWLSPLVLNYIEEHKLYR